jgi:hypothetical protein
MRLNRLAKETRLHLELLEDRNLLSATWTPLTNQFPDPGGTGTMMLLSNGTVMVQDNGFNAAQYNQWFALTPDASGNYANGTWSQLASMSTQRLYFASNVLPSGKVFVLGGEYSGPNLVQNITNTGEIYDPVHNTWSSITPYPEHFGPYFGDDPSMVLPNGNIMAGDIFTNQPMIYNVATDSWSTAGVKNFPDRSDEEGWVQLPNGNVLVYDLFRSIGHDIGRNGDIPLGTPGFYAEMYNAATNSWIDVSPSDGTARATGPMPQLSGDEHTLDFEMGPALLLPNGSVFFVGATGHTALYNTHNNTWSPGPDVIGSLPGGPALFGADDAPAAVLPNGDVLFTADAGPTSGVFSAPTEVFDYNPTANTINQVSSPDPILPLEPAFPDRMLVLPTGQILFSDGGAQLLVYTPNGHPQGSWQPTIQSVTNNNDGTFTLTGKQLNGQSAGATYGDDVEMDSNYPIIYLTAGNQTFYARTYNWSSTGVQTGNALESVNFVLPSGIPAGNYSLYVSGAGISSQAFHFQVTASVATASSGGLSVGAGMASLLSGPTSAGVPAAAAHGHGDGDAAGVSLALTHSGVLTSAKQVGSAPLVRTSADGAAASRSGALPLQAAATVATDYFGLVNREKVVDALFASGLDDALLGG